MNTSALLEVMDKAVKTGARTLLSRLGSDRQAQVKESISSVVTEADLAAEKVILDILKEATPPFNILSEEAGFLNRDSDFTWVVDPLDGSSNFAASLPWFGIILALLDRQEPVLGAMYLPSENRLYLAEKGKGATCNGVPISVHAGTRLEDHLVAYSFDISEERGKTKAEMELLGRLSRRVRNIRSTNSLVDFCYLADGRLGAAMNQTTKIWDIAAAHLIISEAGGRVSDIHGQEISYATGAEDLNRNYTIMATTPSLYEPLKHCILP